MACILHQYYFATFKKSFCCQFIQFTTTKLKVGMLKNVSQSKDAEPHSSVGSVADWRTGGRWFYPWLGQYFLSFRGLMIVFATGSISHRCLLFRQQLFWNEASGLERILWGVIVKRTPGKHGLVHWPPQYN